MTIDRLREALSAIGPPPDARELSEMLWLACHISPAEPEEPSHPAEVVQEPAEPAPPFPRSTPAVPEPPPAPLTRVLPRRAPDAEPVGEASEVLVPTAPMLADPLGVQRALRPLKRRVPSRHRLELDEEATAARIADTRRWTPVLVPATERWLTLSLVVDTGPTMRLWRPLARELAEPLLRQGAFQDVHVTRLDTTGRIASAPGAPLQEPGTLLDASGRHAVLVLSDCSGPHWWDGRAARTVRRWAEAGPTAILQPLAERLWRRTAAPAVPGVAALPRPGAPNTDLRFTPYDGPVESGLGVPVLEVAPRWFGAWARLVSASGPQPAAVATFPPRPSGTAPVHRERELPIAERVRRFLTTASPDAAELAAHVAVSEPSLPVMRLIQHRVLGRSGPGQLAEVLLSGLLRSVGGVRYEFVPGAREALLDTLPRPEALHTRHVLKAVSAEIESRAGTSAERFRALLPTDGGPVALAADTDHFALLTPETRSHLAPGPPPPPARDLLDVLDTPIDELLGDDWEHRPPHPTAIGVRDNGGTAWIDIIRGGGYAQHGMITGPPSACHETLRTIMLSLALAHSPNRVTFALVNCFDFYESEFFLGLGALPHMTGDEPVLLRSETGAISMLRGLIRRRETMLGEAGARTWDDYQRAIAAGRRLGPIPAVVVIMGIGRRASTIDPDLRTQILQLCAIARDKGVHFIFYPAERSAEMEWFSSACRWQVNFPDRGATRLPLLKNAGQDPTRFHLAQIALEVALSIVSSLASWQDTAAPEFDVLRLNAGADGTFEETWAIDSSTPRNPAIGHDAEGNVVTLHPLDVSAEISHGLIAGETEARQRIVRAITLAVAANYSPADVTFAFAGLGEHPLGDPIDLRHVIYSADELLGRPDKLQEFIEYFSNPYPRANVLPRLVLVVDISLTFPSSRREVGEMLLSLVQRGRGLGVQLILTSSMVENTTMWSRFLPLLDWRIAASGLAPAELQRLAGRPGLSFPDGRTAYLLAGGDPPRRFSVAPTPAREAVDEFVDRARNWADEYVSAEPSVADGVAHTLNPSRNDRRHAMLESSDWDHAVSEAQRIGRILRLSGVLSNGEVHHIAELDVLGRHGEPTTNWPDLFFACRGGVLLIHVGDIEYLSLTLQSSIDRDLPRMMDRHGKDPAVIICGNSDELHAFERAHPAVADRFVRFRLRTAHRQAEEAETATGAHVLLGRDPRTREVVSLDFATDRHLLIDGPPGSGKATIIRALIQRIAEAESATERRLYFLDQRRPPKSAFPAFAEQFGVRYCDDADEFDSLIAEIASTARTRLETGLGPACYVFLAPRPLVWDQVAPLLGDLAAGPSGLHLVVSCHDRRDTTDDRLVTRLRALDVPLLLVGTRRRAAEGRTAELWGVPASLRGLIPDAHGVLARGGEHRRVRFTGP